MCVADIHTNTGNSDPDSNCDIHGNTHVNCYGDAGFHAHSYSYGYIHHSAECYADSYFYCNNSSDSDGYSAADAHRAATSNTAVAAYATTKAVTEQLQGITL